MSCMKTKKSPTRSVHQEMFRVKDHESGHPSRDQVKDYKRQNSRWIDDEESEDSFLSTIDSLKTPVLD